ncbi:hypothetical protein PHLGIDRAFT_35967 [Phlebiopsis gigantea 11061_1 CR5-6]|uniref:Uncharacterized protein n=1 Tax=Phlebiopsis gigantea (strain 11061_1 CR5-6) TaxID=745531 RepID=A0A0C3PJL9_PHLG1|nr:hypothetical protein PHLGIDRAFT_35967 [Phlebiopsis gigantea 11061_1 CR5-6]
MSSFPELDSPDCPGILVPQKVYHVKGQGNWNPIPPISLQRNGTLGVRLQDALREPVTGLVNGRTIPTLSTTSMRAALRIQWPGYGSWSVPNALHSLDHTNQAKPHNLAHVVYQVAKIVRSFYNDVASTEPNPDWHLGRIPFSQLYLVQLRNVSAGSWQPVIAYEPR